MRAIITRYAPAPTGFLHIGHVVNAIYVWGVTRAAGGRVLLRIEDHDRQRCRAEYDAALVEDLAWLGFVSDDAPVRQSARSHVYTRALDDLRARGLVYACECSRAQIAKRGAEQAPPLQVSDVDRARVGDELARPPSDDLRYPGTCRDRGIAEGPGFGVRIRLDPTIERFVDLVHGPQAQQPAAQCGDLLARDRGGNWTYQFAATVDDWQQGVTLVVRGDDLLESTGRQIQLARLLGRLDPPRFLHHPLVMKSPSQKVSKADGDTGIRELRARGWTADAVIGRAAALAGLIPEPRDLRAGEVSSIMSSFKEVLS